MKGSYSELNNIRNIVKEWQSNGYVHPLTCGNESRHQNLVAQLDKQGDSFELLLVCEDCDWTQDIPPYFISANK